MEKPNSLNGKNIGETNYTTNVTIVLELDYNIFRACRAHFKSSLFPIVRCFPKLSYLNPKGLRNGCHLVKNLRVFTTSSIVICCNLCSLVYSCLCSVLLSPLFCHLGKLLFLSTLSCLFHLSFPLILRKSYIAALYDC